jgi:hypothetical protein
LAGPKSCPYLELEMPFTNFPQGFAAGLSVRGMPLLQAQPGQIFWVNNSTILNPNQKPGSDGNRGTFLDPFSTLAFALSQCVQGRGDIVMVGAGHRESIADATTLYMNCNSVAVIGLGSGTTRPTFTFTTATTANIPIRSSGMSIQNCLFLNNFADIASTFTGIRGSSATSTISGTTFTAVGAITGAFYPGMTLAGTGVTSGTFITAQLTGTATSTGATFSVYPSQTVTSTTITGLTTDFAIDNCEFRDLSSALNALTVVTGNTTANSMDGLSFTNNRISSLATTAATTAIVLSSATDRVRLTDNYGNWAILNNTATLLAGGANNITNLDVGRNRVNRPNTSTTGGLLMSSSSTACTGHMYDNYVWSLTSTPIIVATGTKLAFTQNFLNNTGSADKSGLLLPAAA